ncbi:PIN domain-like protein, partial [Fomitiporia mediterranea MF3/22]|uniref:PIN domain-like protein n=1 Tax=Fomitiporia mediterranea (strain MF3/22) TaxID=694068 RepID=UPI000440921D
MGVKSLWSLLSPAGRPVMLETAEGKSMAIDSSIWIYQFQATMRDKEGRGLVNAHVLGFLRRICKLLFYGIKPVFVFDGGAPALKRMTIAERKKKKSGAAESHARIAEKLLAAQMRKEALSHAQSSTKSGSPRGPVSLDEHTVYLEDLDGSHLTVTPARNKGKVKEAPSSAKKSRWQDYDPYRLPEVDMDAAVAKVTRSTAPDPRLATEDELRTFIDMMRPEDLNVHSPAFRELPTEVQYEIIGDLRLKSRQTSHKRLQAMLCKSKSPLDFSYQQIQNLKQRNDLTQQLLETTDNIGKANVTIPIRIASERNKEYLLIRNDDELGGWVLGIRDDGTQDKPIVLDNADEHVKSDEESDDDMDMEEVTIPQAADPDLKEYQRELALGAVEGRRKSAAARGRPKDTTTTKKISPKKDPLFIPDTEDGNVEMEYETDDDWENTEEAEMFSAMQASLEDQEAEDLRKALEESRKAVPDKASGMVSHAITDEDSDDDLYVDYTPSRLDAALRFANTSRNTGGSSTDVFPRPSISRPALSAQKAVIDIDGSEDDDEDMEEVEPYESTTPSVPQPQNRVKEVVSASPVTPQRKSEIAKSPVSSTSTISETKAITRKALPSAYANNDPATNAQQRLEHVHSDASSSSPVATSQNQFKRAVTTTNDVPAVTTVVFGDVEKTQGGAVFSVASGTEIRVTPSGPITVPEPKSLSFSQQNETRDVPKTDVEQVVISHVDHSSPEDSSGDEAWSRAASPSGVKGQDDTDKREEDWDAADEMNVHEETGEFARFAAQVRGRDLDTVRAEIDDEIRQLREQRKAAMRDAEDVNQAMIAQIMTMLRLFGIPYITAPMEAEAQCAALVDLGLVDGVITDDSDVFLFGAKRVYKNMFNQSKTVECFLLTDLARELGLDRGTLIRLAYLLGSDYTLGLPGVGPVVAMELLQEFPGDDGLHKFKDWWMKVQSGRDRESDNISNFRRRFKKRFKDLYLPGDWPNPAVRDAYYHPVVDTSEEPFKWGLPDLDGLRSFFHDELSWNAGKVDELLLPIIQRMNKRGQQSTANRQDTLNTFFSVSEGAGAAEPRRREAYASRRLQALVTAHRKAQKARTGGTDEGSSEEEEKQPAKKRAKKASLEEESEIVRGKKERTRKNGPPGKRGAKGASDGNREGSGTPSETKQKGTRKSRAKTKGKSTARSTADSPSDTSEEFVPGGAPDDAPAREMTLRKRVKPRPAFKGDKAVNVYAKGEEEDNMLGALDSGSEESEYRE